MLWMIGFKRNAKFSVRFRRYRSGKKRGNRGY